MNATDTIRESLKERNVTYREYPYTVPGSMESASRFYIDGPDDLPFACIEAGRDSETATTVLTLRCTADTAVETALGRGTCKVKRVQFWADVDGDSGYEFYMGCENFFSWGSDDPPDFCPWCGRKIECEG